MSSDPTNSDAPARPAASDGKPAASPGPSDGGRPMAQSKLWTAQIVGMDELRGKPLGAGTVLDLIDLNAGRLSATYASGPVVTLSFDRVSLSVPILHGDLVRFEGAVVKVGRSSMLIEIVVKRHDSYTNEYVKTHHVFVTMVAVDAQTGRPRRNLPPLLCGTDEERAVAERVVAREKVVGRWRQIEEEVQSRKSIAAADVEDTEANRGTAGAAAGRAPRTTFVSIPSTEVVVRYQYLPRARNHAGSVFGGEILQGMDKVATYCARNFCQSECLTIAMDRVVFKKPLKTSDLVEMRARVVYVRTYVLMVEVRVYVHAWGADKDAGPVLSHTGYFTCLNYHRHTKRRIPNGLLLEDEDEDALRSYALARELHQMAARTVELELDSVQLASSSSPRPAAEDADILCDGAGADQRPSAAGQASKRARASD